MMWLDEEGAVVTAAMRHPRSIMDAKFQRSIYRLSKKRGQQWGDELLENVDIFSGIVRGDEKIILSRSADGDPTQRRVQDAG